MPKLTVPVTFYREQQPYVAIKVTVDIREVPSVVPPLIPEVAYWMEQHDLPEQGPCFFRYLSCTQNGRITVEAGIPSPVVSEGNGRIEPGYFPPGRYLKLTHMGHYSNLRQAHMFLESWVGENGLVLDQQMLNGDVLWSGRSEFYINDCERVPDPEKWQTDILFLLAD
jgi:effector-binding domain-containing protein